MLRSYASLVFITGLVVSLCSACGGGGAASAIPNMGNQQPTTLQPSPAQQEPTEPFADPPDTTTIIAVFNDQKMEFSMGSGIGAVLPNARVVIEDPQNFVASIDADADGRFEFTQADVPPNFMTAPGTQIGIMQFDANTRRSDPAYVTIQLVSIP